MKQPAAVFTQRSKYRQPAFSSLQRMNASDVAEILRYIPTSPPYEDWIRIISAVGSVLSVEEAVVVLAAWSAEKSPGEYQAKLHSGLTHVGIGSLIHRAKAHGFDPTTITRKPGSFGAKSCALPQSAPLRSDSAMKWKLNRFTSRAGSAEELDTLAKLRRLPSPEGLEAMQEARCLAFSDDLTDKTSDGAWRPVKAWLVRDPSGRNVSARRLDGLGWNCIREAKSRCLSGPGSKSWPVGLTLAKPGQRLDVVEGEGDLVALWHLHAIAKVTDAAPVGLLGSCVNLDSLPPEVGSHIAGRTIQIFVHRDANGAGQSAAKKWSDSFYRLGAAVVFARDLSPWLEEMGKDLNDAVAETDARKITTPTPEQCNQ